MRLRPLPCLFLALLAPACWPSEEPLADEPDPVTGLRETEVELPAPNLAAEAAAELPPDDPETTLTWPLSARAVDLEAGRADAFTSDGDAIVFAGGRDGRVSIARLVADGDSGTRVQATLDGGPIGAQPIVLAQATRQSPATAAWTDDDGAIWAVVVDAHLGEAQARKILTPSESEGKAAGHPVVAPSDDGTLVCTGGDSDVLRCATITRAGELGAEGWLPLGKTKALRTEALLESPSGWLLVAASCRPLDTCKRKDLVVVRLGADTLPPKKRPTLPLPEVQARRDGLLLVPTDTGFVLVGKRIGANDPSAWRVTDRDVKELDGKWSRVVGGLDSDAGLVFIERAPLAMQDGFPVVRFRPRMFADGERGDVLAWPGAIDRRVPTGVDQTVLSGERMVVFVAPIRKQRVRATVLQLGADVGG